MYNMLCTKIKTNINNNLQNFGWQSAILQKNTYRYGKYLNTYVIWHTHIHKYL